MEHAVGIKLGYITAGPLGWSDLLVRAILCNLMINVAMLLVYNGFIKDDLTKSLAMIMSVFIFAFLGLEHSVANTILFTIVGFKSGHRRRARRGQRGDRPDRATSSAAGC